MKLHNILVHWLVIFVLNSDFSRCSKETDIGLHTRRISYGDSPPAQYFKFVAYVTIQWCENVPGNNKCQQTVVFTATVISHGYLLTSSQVLPCVVRYKLLVGPNASNKYSFSNLRFIFNFGSVDVNDVPAQTINALYPDDMDIFLKTDSVIIPAEASKKWFCPIDLDIALLFVRTYIKFNTLVQPIPILRLPISSRIDENCIAVSFGIQENGKFDGKLHSAKVSFGDNNYCRQLDDHYIHAHEKPYIVCSKGKDLREVCGSDTGSPLVCGDEQSYYLVGIMSVTDDAFQKGEIHCGRSSTQYARYTYPGYFENWLSGVGIEFVSVQKTNKVARQSGGKYFEDKEAGTNTSSIPAGRSPRIVSREESSLAGLTQDRPWYLIIMVKITLLAHHLNVSV